MKIFVMLDEENSTGSLPYVAISNNSKDTGGYTVGFWSTGGEFRSYYDERMDEEKLREEGAVELTGLTLETVCTTIREVYQEKLRTAP